MRMLPLALLFLPLLSAAERKPVFPQGMKTVGPYSPGIFAGDYFYVSGQGARDASGKMAATGAEQTKECLEHIKAILQAAGLGMDDIVYTHSYLTDIRNYAPMTAAYASYFKGAPPPNATIGVVRMPLDTPVEISAIALRGNAAKPADRMFLPGILSPGADLGNLKSALKAAHVAPAKLVYLAAYRTPAIPRPELERSLRALAPQAAISVLDVASLPSGANLGITGLAARAATPQSYKKAGETLCASVAETVYCAARPAPNVQAALEAIGIGLQALGSSLARAVANTVYLDDIDNFKTMNAAYGQAFPAPPPARTTIAPAPPAHVVQVAVIAVQ